MPVFSLAPISEVMHYLYTEQIPVFIEGEQRTISPSLKKVFDDYLAEYGTVV